MRPSLYILAWLVGMGCSDNGPSKVDEPGAGVGSVITGDDIVGGDGGSTSEPDEVCDGIDNDGDGEVDEGTLLTFYVDADGDGYGGEAVEACEAPLGTVETDGDCDDEDPAVNPAAVEACNSIDDDCDGYTDEGLLREYYVDADDDGYGTPIGAVEACEMPEGYVDNRDDCDDGSALVSPDQPEACNGTDDNCDGRIDEGVSTTYYSDADGDGFGDTESAFPSCGSPTGVVSLPGDCDDTNPLINPAADEVCDGVDQDCDGVADDGAVDGTVASYMDVDGDGFGAGAAVIECTVPSGYSPVDGDCDDFDPFVSPDALEVCNGQDDDCDAAVDEGLLTEFYTDGDGDGFGTEPVLACSLPPGAGAEPGDCDDARADVNPGADEACDSVDNDCDGTVDEGLLIEFFVDGDGDGFGTESVYACERPADAAAEPGDCDDDRADVNPGAEEVCDDADNDCDSAVDEGVRIEAFVDDDGDGFGTTPVSVCSIEPGTAAEPGDCDDDRADINPEAEEVCDGIDNDCDGTADADAIDAPTWYADGDLDGFGDPESAAVRCAAPSGFIAASGDCDDDRADVYPDADERCDDRDNDCDGSVDEDTVDTPRWYPDDDGDGYGQDDDAVDACDAPDGYVASNTDCDDDDDTTYPGADEYCDERDNDCDGEEDEGAVDGFLLYVDDDGDGYGTGETIETCEDDDDLSDETGDCNDDDDDIYPGAFEDCDGVDQNCDGIVDNTADCPCTQYNYDGNSYLFCTDSRRWTSARNECRDYGYELVTINAALEQEWLLTVIRTYWDVPNDSYWTGLNDRSSERGGSRSGWTWVSGQPYTFSAWHSTYYYQPDNYGNEDCVEVNRWSTSVWDDWNDLRCGDNLYYVCEAG